MIENDLHSIAILRALKLGDMLCATPSLRAIRRHWPRAHIALIALPWFRELADRYSHLFDELIEFPGYPGLPEQDPEPDAVARFLHDMRGRSFDLVVQMHGSGEVTNPLVSQFAARQSAGFHIPDMGSRDAATYQPWVEDRSETLRCLDLLCHLGVPLQGPELELPLTAWDMAQLAHLRHDHFFVEAPYACVHAGASVPERRWSAESFAKVADRLSRLGYTVILTGGPEEQDLTSRVAAMMHERSIDLAGRTSLGLLAALVSQAVLVVCNDTGLSHIAAATRTPSVVVSPVSDPRRWAPVDRNRHRVVDARIGASVDDVWRAIDGLQRDFHL